MNNTDTHQLGKEFWGILNFRCSLSSLYDYLNVDTFLIEETTFANWVLFPDQIPADIRNFFLEQLKPQGQTYSTKIMSEQQEKLHNQVVEMIRVKYSGEFLSPQSFVSLYQLSESALQGYLTRLVDGNRLNERKKTLFLEEFNKVRGCLS